MANERDRKDEMADRGPEQTRPMTDDGQVARRAYERYQERGGEHGHDQEDWYAAEQEIRGGTTSPSSGGAASSGTASGAMSAPSGSESRRRNPAAAEPGGPTESSR
jgi:hypothetical protein